MRQAKNFITVLLVYYLLSSAVAAQEMGIGSHAKIIAKGKPDTSVLKSYERLADIFSGSNPDTVLHLSKKAMELVATSLPGATGRRKYVLLKIRADIYSHQAHVYYYRGDPERCLEFLNRSYLIYQEINYLPGLGSCLNDIGFIYDKQGNVEKALEYTLEGLRLSEKHVNKSQRASALNNIAIYYDKLGDTDNALESHYKSLALREELENKEGIANSLGNIAVIHRKLGEDEKALDHYKRAAILQEAVNHMQGKARTLMGISDIYADGGELQKSLEVGREALQIARKLGYPESMRDAAASLVRVEKQLGYMDSALAHYHLHILMKDSISTREMEKWEAEREIKSETAKEMLVLEEEKKTREALAQKEKEQGELILYAVAVVLLLIIVFALVMVNRFRKARENKKLIEKQKRMVEERKTNITDSIRYAENIQKALLPGKTMRSKLPEHFVLFSPKDIVSGDFYWITENAGRVYFAACDCTGHGVPGAFMSMLNLALLTEAVIEKKLIRPSEIFFDVRRGIIDMLKQTGETGSHKDGMDAVICAWDKNDNLEYALAYNPFFLIRDGELIETKPDKMPVGILSGEQVPYTNHKLTIQKGDTIYIFSDGYHDQFGGPKEKKFMIKNFKKLLLSIQDKSMAEQNAMLEDTMKEWMGGIEQVDDILVMGVRF